MKSVLVNFGLKNIYFEGSNNDVDVGSEKSSAQSGHGAPESVVVDTSVFVRKCERIRPAEEERRPGDQNASAQRQKDICDMEQSAFLLRIENKI